MDKAKFMAKCLAIVLIPFLFVSDIHSYTRVMMDELYQDGRIDVLFLGASHTYRSYDVAKIEKGTGLNGFNAGSSSQQLQGSYYLLKEANENNGVDTVILDVTYMMMDYEEPEEKATYIISDYIRDLSNKYDYLYDAFGLKGVENGILPYLHGISVSPQTVIEHITRNYKNDSYEYVTYSHEAYKGQGFVYNYENVSDDYIFQDTEMNVDHLFSDFSLQYMQKIIDYCKENDIDLKLVDPPMPDGTLVSAKYFQNYVDAVRRIASINNLEYWEFNLVRKQIMTLTRDDFQDNVHLNGHGAEKFTQCIVLMLNQELVEPFYDTYEEKLTLNPDGTYVEIIDQTGRVE